MDDKYLEWERECYMRRVNRHRTRREQQRRACIRRTLFFLALIVALSIALMCTLRAKEERRMVIVNEIVAMPEIIVEDEPALIELGEFVVTHYCGGACCCGAYADGITATGTKATEGRTIAVDPSVIPYGSEVAVFYDDGRICYYIAEDCGAAIKGNRIDVFMDSHADALESGVVGASVYLVKE